MLLLLLMMFVLLFVLMLVLMLVLGLRLKKLLIRLGFLNLLLNRRRRYSLLLLLPPMLLLGGDGPVGRSAASGLLDLQIGNAVPDVFADEALRRFEQRQIRLLIDAHLEFHVVFLPDDEVRKRVPELGERRLEIVSEGGRLVILKWAVSEDAFGEVVEERHGEFVVDRGLVRRRVVQYFANSVRLLVVVQKLVHECNVYLVILIVFGAVIVVRVVGILEATIVLVEMGKVQFLFPSTVC